MTRWWGVAALALSIGLNAGLVVAVLQQRWQPAMVVVPPAGVPAAGPAIDGWSVAQPFPAAGSGASGAVPAAPGGSGLEAGAEAGVRGGSPADPGGAAAGAAGSPAWPGVGAGAAPPGAAAPEAPPAEPPRLAENRAPGPAVPAREEPPAPPRRDAPPLARLEEMAERLGVPEADRPRLFAVQRRFFTAT